MIAGLVVSFQIVNHFVDATNAIHTREEFRYFSGENWTTESDVTVLSRHLNRTRMRDYPAEFRAHSIDEYGVIHRLRREARLDVCDKSLSAIAQVTSGDFKSFARLSCC